MKEELFLIYVLMEMTQNVKTYKNMQSISFVSLQVSFVIREVFIDIEGRSPASYFHFNGFNANLHFKMVERLPGNKIGYSVSFWIKINHFLADEVGLLSWRVLVLNCMMKIQDQNGFNLFEIYFKSLPQSIGEKPKYCLCAQTQNYPTPPGLHGIGEFLLLSENIVFEQPTFEETDVWRHLVISHSQQKITIIVDGELVQVVIDLFIY